MGASGEKLQKVLAAHGFGSRRKCEELIAQGRVEVDGGVAAIGCRIDVSHQEVLVDGVGVTVRPGSVYYLLNKPKGVMCTSDDPQGRPKVTDLVPANPRVFSVGRLDAATQGLLLLTNDGALTHRLIHPAFGVEKEYLASLQSAPGKAAINKLRNGVTLGGRPTAPARVTALGPQQLRIVIHEGRNRQVRRMCEAVGHPIEELVRTRIGPIADKSLKPGQWRELTPQEVRQLCVAASANS